MAPRAIIIGAPGAGKTSVGRRVAERLGVEFRDSDAAIEKRAGKPVSDIFLSDGETAFRRLEREVIAESLEEVDGVGICRSRNTRPWRLHRSDAHNVAEDLHACYLAQHGSGYRSEGNSGGCFSGAGTF